MVFACVIVSPCFYIGRSVDFRKGSCRNCCFLSVTYKDALFFGLVGGGLLRWEGRFVWLYVWRISVWSGYLPFGWLILVSFEFFFFFWMVYFMFCLGYVFYFEYVLDYSSWLLAYIWSSLCILCLVLIIICFLFVIIVRRGEAARTF